jgi:hypothetical protein
MYLEPPWTALYDMLWMGGSGFVSGEKKRKVLVIGRTVVVDTAVG